jgi:Tol biopolymer transport system component
LGAAWLPDGGGIVFASGWRGENGVWLTAPSNEATPRRLPFAPTSANEPAVTRSGNRLVYTTYRQDTNIWRLEAVASGRRQTAPVPIVSSTKLDWDPAVSPDGKALAFISERSGAQEVWLCDLDGSNPRQLTPRAGADISGPQWSPDGQSIAVTIFGKREVQVGIVNASSGGMRALSIPGGGKWPSWSRDGKWLYFAKSGHPSSIWKIRPDGGVPVQLTWGSTDDMPQASFDGKYIYYNKGWPGPLSIWRISVDGGNETKLVEGVSNSGQWISGPEGIYYFAAPDIAGRSEMRLYESSTGRTKKLLTAERSVGFRIAVSPDGRTIFFPQIDEQGSDLMLVENFR